MVQAAARAIGQSASTIHSARHCIGLAFYGALAVAYDQLGTAASWNVKDGQVAIVKLPEWEADGNGNVVQKNSWAEVAPEEWYQYFAFQKTVSSAFIQCCIMHRRNDQGQKTRNCDLG